MGVTEIEQLHNATITDEQWNEINENEHVECLDILGNSSSHIGLYWWDVQLDNGKNIDVFCK